MAFSWKSNVDGWRPHENGEEWVIPVGFAVDDHGTVELIVGRPHAPIWYGNEHAALVVRLGRSEARRLALRILAETEGGGGG